MKKAFLEKTCKPFALSKDYVSIFRIEKNDKFIFVVRFCWDGITKDEPVTSYAEALYKFYYNLCWLLNEGVMGASMDQRIKPTREIDIFEHKLQRYFEH